MSAKETAKRYILFVISLFFSAMGVAVTRQGELGVSPLSSVANVMNCRFTEISMGTWLIIWNCILILGQVLLKGKKFRLIQLLQVPVSFLFGYFTDFWTMFAVLIPNEIYAVRIGLVVAGTAVLGFGISLSVIADVVMNSGEAFVKAVSDKTGKKFGNVKIVFDISCVVLSVLLSLALFDMKIVGAREGTVIAALLTGVAVKLFCSLLKKPLDRILSETA